MNTQTEPMIQGLLSFLNDSPTAWHAVERATQDLKKSGFIELQERDRWTLQPGGKYLVTRNGSSLCAFVVPQATPSRVRLLASHSDSPALKLKPQPEIRKQHMTLLGVEIYGAPLLSSWLNRDLGIAGRVVYYNSDDQMQESLVRLDDYPLMIPQLAIHLDREVNEKGLILNKQDHLNALAAIHLEEPSSDSPYLEKILKQQIPFKQLLSWDLFLYPLEPARLIGFQKQLIASYRLDNLASFYASLYALKQETAPLQDEIKMMACWDNEEIGSNTSHGASSPFISQVLERIVLSFKGGREEYFQLLNRSFCISSDLAHALHPNYADKHDAQHQPLLGKGVVLKSNAQYRYASDARSSSFIHALAKKNGWPLQSFVSRNDIPCGTTIGPIHASETGMTTVDIGGSQLSMHSIREIMACQDCLYLCQLFHALMHTTDIALL